MIPSLVVQTTQSHEKFDDSFIARKSLLEAATAKPIANGTISDFVIKINLL